MAYFLGRDVDVFITLETDKVDKAIGLNQQNDSLGYPICAVVGSGTAAPSGTIFANTMYDSPANVSGGRVHDLTGVDLSISASDEEVGPFLGHAATQSVELRKEQVITLTHKKSDEVWDAVFNGPSDITTFEGSYTNAAAFSGTTGEATLSGGTTDVAAVSVGDYVGGDDAIALGTQVISKPTTTTLKLSKNLTATVAAMAAGTVGFNPLPTFRRQGARAGVVYQSTSVAGWYVASGRRPPWQTTSGTSYGNPGETTYYGYRVHIKMKGGGEVYTVKNAVVTGHTVSMNADGTTEESMELKAGIPATMYTGADDTFFTELTQVGEY
jgi:hypothetical protein